MIGITLNPLRMVLELITGGDLFNFIHPYKENRKKSLPSAEFDWKLRLKFGLDIALGMRYLQHGLNPPVIHRDLRSPNIFVCFFLFPSFPPSVSLPFSSYPPPPFPSTRGSILDHSHLPVTLLLPFDTCPSPVCTYSCTNQLIGECKNRSHQRMQKIVYVRR